MTDILDLPEDQYEEQPVEQPAPAGSGVTIRTMNANQGAVRVDVRRSFQRVRQSIVELAAIVGEGWEYGLPFKKRDKQTGETKVEIVRGPSIRCTTAIARAYGNCDVSCECVSETGGAYQFVATFLDIETGFRLARPFRQRKDQNVGSMGGDRGRVEDVIFQIGASKGTRNVIRNALPDLCEFAIKEARDELSKKIEKSKPKVVKRIVERLEEFGIPLLVVERFYQIKLDPQDDTLSAKVLAQIVRILQAVADGMITGREAFEQSMAPAGGGPLKESDEADEPQERDPLSSRATTERPQHEKARGGMSAAVVEEKPAPAATVDENEPASAKIVQQEAEETSLDLAEVEEIPEVRAETRPPQQARRPAPSPFSDDD